MTPNKYIYEVSFILRYNFNENTPYEISIYKLCLQQANPTTFQCHIKQHYKLRFSQVQRHYEEIISYSDTPTQFFYFSKSFFSKKPFKKAPQRVCCGALHRVVFLRENYDRSPAAAPCAVKPKEALP